MLYCQISWHLACYIIKVAKNRQKELIPASVISRIRLCAGLNIISPCWTDWDSGCPLSTAVPVDYLTTELSTHSGLCLTQKLTAAWNVKKSGQSQMRPLCYPPLPGLRTVSEEEVERLQESEVRENWVESLFWTWQDCCTQELSSCAHTRPTQE